MNAVFVSEAINLAIIEIAPQLYPVGSVSFCPLNPPEWGTLSEAALQSSSHFSRSKSLNFGGFRGRKSSVMTDQSLPS